MNNEIRMQQKLHKLDLSYFYARAWKICKVGAVKWSRRANESGEWMKKWKIYVLSFSLLCSTLRHSCRLQAKLKLLSSEKEI